MAAGLGPAGNLTERMEPAGQNGKANLGLREIDESEPSKFLTAKDAMYAKKVCSSFGVF